MHSSPSRVLLLHSHAGVYSRAQQGGTWFPGPTHSAPHSVDSVSHSHAAGGPAASKVGDPFLHVAFFFPKEGGCNSFLHLRTLEARFEYFIRLENLRVVTVPLSLSNLLKAGFSTVPWSGMVDRHRIFLEPNSRPYWNSRENTKARKGCMTSHSHNSIGKPRLAEWTQLASGPQELRAEAKPPSPSLGLLPDVLSSPACSCSQVPFPKMRVNLWP